MDPPPRLELGSVRYRALSALAAGEHTPPKIARATGIALERTVQALNWATRHRPALAELRVWAGHDSLYQITDHGQEILATSAQLALDVS